MANTMNTIDNICAEVLNMLHGVKKGEYGDPLTMHAHIGELWDEDIPYTDNSVEREFLLARTVALKMAKLKIARLDYDMTKEDSYKDAIAYLLFASAFNRRLNEFYKGGAENEG